MNSVYREIMIETIKIVGLTDDKAMELLGVGTFLG